MSFTGLTNGCLYNCLDLLCTSLLFEFHQVMQFFAVCLQASIHAIKSRNVDLASLRDFFCKKYKEGSPSFKLAQVYSSHILVFDGLCLLCIPMLLFK